MNSLQRGVTAIIYSALTGQKISLPEDLNFSECVKIAKRHRIEVMFYHGALNCGFEQSAPAMKELFMSACKSIVLSEQQSYAFAELVSAFDAHKIDFMPIKGIVLKELYPNAQMRSMGDLDILIKTEQYDIIKPIMQELGYTEKIESDHELIWYRHNIHIELHKRLIPSYNKDYYAYFGDGWQLTKVCDGTRYSMTDEDMLIFLFTHFAKHYRDAGIGLKHIVDLWVYKRHINNLNEKYIKDELVKLGLYDFYVNITDTLEVWFGSNESSKMTDFITDYIFDCGVGGYTENYIISCALKYSNAKQVKKSPKVKMILFYVFFPYDRMCIRYPFLKKFPIALPVMWMVRFIGALFNKKRRDSFKNTVYGIENNHILNRLEGLEYVGFHFKE